jgi:hypothetical protein
MSNQLFQLRVTAQTMILFELLLSALLISIGSTTNSEAEILWLLPAILVIHLLIFSAPLAFFKGFDFIIYDAPPDSPWKYYGFIAVFIATLLGSIMDAQVSQLFLAL